MDEENEDLKTLSFQIENCSDYIQQNQTESQDINGLSTTQSLMNGQAMKIWQVERDKYISAMNIPNGKHSAKQRSCQQQDIQNISTYPNSKEKKNLKGNKKNKEEEEFQRRVCEWMIFNRGVSKTLKSYWSIMLKGDVVVGLSQVGKEEFNRLSILNDFKKIKQLIFWKHYGVLEMIFEQKSEGEEDYDKIINLLKKYPNQTFHEFAEGLENHKNRMIQMDAIKQRLNFVQQREQLINISENSYLQFYDRIKNLIVDMTQSGEINAFKYNLFKMDYEKGDFYMTHCITSELLLAVTGLDIEQAGRFCLRKGVWEFINHQDSFGIQKYFLQIAKGSIKNNQVSNVVIKTFDGLEVYVKLRWKIIYNQDPLLLGLYGDKLQHFAIIQCFEFSQSSLDLLLLERESQRDKFDISTLENEGDWQYTLQAQKFIDRFYDENRSNKIDAEEQEKVILI